MQTIPVVVKPTKSHKTMRMDDRLIMKVQEMAIAERRSFGNMIEVLVYKSMESK